MSSALGERLRRLRRGGGPLGRAHPAAPRLEPKPGPDALTRLEERLAGGVEDGLSLKERLERLV
ncbi:MAG TPA: hypothetical protein VMR21_13775, partial [Vicinamibacteria bacterium]|nr:hypothetical protein [Vicinamibacteria bacterium]